MRKLTTAVALALAAFSASAASAMDLTKNLSLYTEVVAEYNVDAGATTLVATPELNYWAGDVMLSAGLELAVYDNGNGLTLADEFDAWPTIDFGASYFPRENLELEALTSYDFDAQQRGDFILRATFNF